jgi:hypothetical protein
LTVLELAHSAAGLSLLVNNCPIAAAAAAACCLLLQMDPNDRSSAEQLLTHPWVAAQGSNPTRTRASLSQEV